MFVYNRRVYIHVLSNKEDVTGPKGGGKGGMKEENSACALVSSTFIG